MENKIRIPKPCTENWNIMTPIEKGKLCEICNRKVYDFTKMNSTEIISVVNSNDRICGKVKKDQIKNNSNSFKKYGLLISFSSLFSFSNLIYAKPIIQFDKSEIHEVKNNNQNYFFNQIETDSISITGTVTENGIPLPKAIIKLKGTDILTETDLDGNFRLNIPKGIKNDMIILEFSHIGMNTKEVIVKNLKRKIKVELEGEYVIGEVIYKKSLWRKIFR